MKICINGSKGKMGKVIIEHINNNKEYTLAGQVDINDNLSKIINEKKPNLVIDFTTPETRMQTIETSLLNNCPIVVGTTGFTPQDLEKIESWVKKTNKGCFIAPNFIIGNVLMQQFATQASKYYENAEIIEYHHEQKVDAPSGTAVKTAQLMGEQRNEFNQNTNDKVDNIQGSRGGNYKGIKIHAIRMPGFIASQEVILGNNGEYLTIRHDSINRECYMPGIFMAAKYIINNNELIYGLEKIL